MRVRAQDADGDYTFGQGGRNFLVNSPAAVAQLILTGLELWRGDWFADTSVGMPWRTNVIGKTVKAIYDLAVRNQILNTTGVQAILAYDSQLDERTRKLSVQATVLTQFGATQVQQVL